MAKLTAMPSKDIVDAFRGTLDFYRWCDLVIVRKWPRSPGRLRNPYVMATGARFAYVNQMASTISPDLQAAYAYTAQDTALSWKDIMVSLYLKGREQLA